VLVGSWSQANLFVDEFAEVPGIERLFDPLAGSGMQKVTGLGGECTNCVIVVRMFGEEENESMAEASEAVQVTPCPLPTPVTTGSPLDKQGPVTSEGGRGLRATATGLIVFDDLPPNLTGHIRCSVDVYVAIAIPHQHDQRVHRDRGMASGGETPR
jgi:hypothetical protein